MDIDPAMMHLLQLADGRFPAGGHVHSLGVESAIADGRITDLPTLAAFARGRTRTVGLTEAALTAAAARRLAAPVSQVPEQSGPWLQRAERLDAEADARQPVEPLRGASRKLGRQLLRAAQRCWDCPALAALTRHFPTGVHQAVALGAVAVCAGIDSTNAARLSVHHTLTTPVQAALRLLGLDPFAAAALIVELSPLAELTALEADIAAQGPLRELPSLSGQMLDIAAITHADLTVRMFAT